MSGVAGTETLSPITDGKAEPGVLCAEAAKGGIKMQGFRGPVVGCISASCPGAEGHRSKVTSLADRRRSGPLHGGPGAEATGAAARCEGGCGARRCSHRANGRAQ